MRDYHLTKEDYEEVKIRLTMKQVAAAYGYPVCRRDSCLCPFHPDRHPSMKLYKNSFYCFSCGAGGIRHFVARLMITERRSRQKAGGRFFSASPTGNSILSGKTGKSTGRKEKTGKGYLDPAQSGFVTWVLSIVMRGRERAKRPPF